MVKIQNLLSAAILFVTACAFAAGYLQTDYVERAENLRQEANFHQSVSNEMKNTFLRINSEDQIIATAADSYLVQAQNLLIEYLNLAPILPTDEENVAYLDRICFNYLQMELTNEATWAYLIYNHFEIEQEEETFTLDVYLELDGYICGISKNTYFSYDPTINVQSAEEYLTETLVATGILAPWDEEYIRSIIQQIVDNYYMPYTISQNTLSWMDMVFDQVLDEIDRATYLTAQARQTEQMGIRIAIGVSITTVSSILATAMSNRLDKKEIDHQFSRVRADVLTDETKLVYGTDKLAVLALIIAALIAAIGLLGPLFMTSPSEILEGILS